MIFLGFDLFRIYALLFADTLNLIIGIAELKAILWKTNGSDCTKALRDPHPFPGAPCYLMAGYAHKEI